MKRIRLWLLRKLAGRDFDVRARLTITNCTFTTSTSSGAWDGETS